MSGWPSGLRRCVQVAVHFCGRGFESHFWQKLFLPKVRPWQSQYLILLPSCNHSRVAQWKRAGPITQRSVDRNYALLRKVFSFALLILFFDHIILIFVDQIDHSGYHVPLAQRIARWTSNPKVLGSIPRWDVNKLLSFSPWALLELQNHKLQLVRMAEWSKAPDSRWKPCLLIGSKNEISGPLMRAGVRIPFLTATTFGRTFPVSPTWSFCLCRKISLGI